MHGPPGRRLSAASDFRRQHHLLQRRQVLGPDLRATGPVPRADAEGWCSQRPDRPVTTYEGRGLTADRRITDLVALRT